MRDREIVGYFYRCVKVLDPRQWVYESRSSADIATRYDAWARDYDRDMEGRYDSPSRAAAQLARHVPDRSARILDVGCGTGLVGHALGALGYTNLHGLDMSREMLAEAEKKGCYERLFQYDLVADADVERYPVIAAVGCVTYGHAPGYTLARMYAWLAPGGIFHISVRRDFMAEDLYVGALLGGLRWELLEEDAWQIADGTQEIVGLLLKKH